jgi:NAD-dependent SIR2 family protein deacetylase
MKLTCSCSKPVPTLGNICMACQAKIPRWKLHSHFHSGLHSDCPECKQLDRGKVLAEKPKGNEQG